MKKIVYVFLVLIFFVPAAHGGVGHWNWSGVRLGTFETGQGTGFTQFEAWSLKNLRWNWTVRGGWHIQSAIEASVGGLQGAGVEAAFVAAGPVLVLRKGNSPWSFDIGSRPTLISEYQFGPDGFGGNFQFTSAGSVNRDIGDKWTIGYRFHHMSNARIYDENDGINFHFIQIGWRAGR